MSKKVKVSRTGTRRLALFLFVVGLMCSCSTAQRINVKQNNGEQEQETTIEMQGKLENLSLSIINSPVLSNSLTACK